MFEILVFHPRLVGMIKKTISRYFPINVGVEDGRLIVAAGRGFVSATSVARSAARWQASDVFLYLNVGVRDGRLVVAPGGGFVSHHLQQVSSSIVHNILRDICK
jgi:hypothetical protein